MVKKNNLYKKSIETKNIDDIRLYRNNRNNYYKEIKQAKTKYFTTIFTDNNKKGGEKREMITKTCIKLTKCG